VFAQRKPQDEPYYRDHGDRDLQRGQIPDQRIAKWSCRLSIQTSQSRNYDRQGQRFHKTSTHSRRDISKKYRIRTVEISVDRSEQRSRTCAQIQGNILGQHESRDTHTDQRNNGYHQYVEKLFFKRRTTGLGKKTEQCLQFAS